jgi:hypothetical protein
MAIPTAQVIIGCAADENGIVFSEDWAGDLSKWLCDPANRYGPPVLHADDGLGSRFARLTTTSGPSLVTFSSRSFFDQTQPIRVIYRFRANSTLGFGTQIGVGTLYAGEPDYIGLWASHDGGDPGAVFFGFYELTSELISGATNYVELEWDPATCTERFRTSPSGSWVTRVGDFEPHQADQTPYPGWPVAFMVQSPYPDGYLDLGAVQVTGVPMYGAADLLGFYGWLRNGCSYYDGMDLRYHLGGLTSTPVGGGTFLGYNDPAAGGRITRSWDAQSEIIAPASGFGYSELRFIVYNAATGLKANPGEDLRLYVRDSATGTLVPDSQVPGNSLGLVDSAPTMTGALAMGAGQGSIGTQHVDLTGVPRSVHVYLDVQGTSSSATTDYKLQARLGGVWIGFRRLALNAPAGPAHGALTLTGTRTPGTTVSVEVT